MNETTTIKITTLPIWERKENPLEVCKTDFYTKELFARKKGRQSF